MHFFPSGDLNLSAQRVSTGSARYIFLVIVKYLRGLGATETTFLIPVFQEASQFRALMFSERLKAVRMISLLSIVAVLVRWTGLAWRELFIQRKFPVRLAGILPYDH